MTTQIPNTTSVPLEATEEFFYNKQKWENKIRFMEQSKIFLDYFAKDLIQRSKTEFFDEEKKEATSVKILDVATGTGLIPFIFTDEKPLGDEWIVEEIQGIDISSTMIEGSQFKKESRMEMKNTQFDWNNLNFQVMDGQDLKFEDSSFEVVYSNMSVMLFPNILQGLKEVHRVLKDGGMAFINSWTEHFPTRIFFNASFDVLGLQGRERSPVFSLKDPTVFEQYCKDAGFSKVEITQTTQNLPIKFGELYELMNVGSDRSEFVRKYLREHPECLETEEEILKKIEDKILNDFNAMDPKDVIISIANVAILTK